MIVQQTLVPCGVRPKRYQNFARRSHVSSFSDSLTNRKKAVTRLQNCLATIDEARDFRRLSWESHTMALRLSFTLRNKMYTSQFKTNV